VKYCIPEVGDRDIEGRKLQALRNPDRLVGLVQNAEVEGEQGADDGQERQPEPGGLAQEISGEEGGDQVHGQSCVSWFVANAPPRVSGLKSYARAKKKRGGCGCCLPGSP
jgi:hypothetical protein